MSVLSRLAGCLLVLAAAAGCAKTTVTSRDEYVGERIARPDRIVVYDFAGTPADLPSGSAAQYAPPVAPPTAQESDLIRQLGAEVAKDLVQEIQGMGLPAVRAVGQPAPRPGDIAIMGYFVSVDSGSAAKRIGLGFGAGTADLKTKVEGYLMTDKGLRRLGSGEVEAGGSKTPGLAAPPCRRRRERKPDRPHRQRRGEGRRGSDEQEHDRALRQADGQRDWRSAPGGIQETGLDLVGPRSSLTGR